MTYSQAVKVGKTIYISATVAVDAEGRLVSPGDMAGQLDAIYTNLGATLKAEGASFGEVVVERIYTTDMEGLLKVTDRRLKYYRQGQLPATSWRSKVRRLVDPAPALLAIEAVAELLPAAAVHPAPGAAGRSFAMRDPFAPRPPFVPKSRIDRRFDQYRAGLVNSGERAVLVGGLKGVEKESLRVTPRTGGSRWRRTRVRSGSALTHEHITTDFSRRCSSS